MCGLFNSWKTPILWSDFYYFYAYFIVIHFYLFSFNFAARENEILSKTSVGGKKIFSVCQMAEFKF